MYEEKLKTDMRPNIGLRVCLHIWPTTIELFVVNAIKKVTKMYF